MDDEQRLLKGLARRDRASWSALYDRHVREIFGFIYHLVGGNRHLAEELVEFTGRVLQHLIGPYRPLSAAQPTGGSPPTR